MPTMHATQPHIDHSPVRRGHTLLSLTEVAHLLAQGAAAQLRGPTMSSECQMDATGSNSSEKFVDFLGLQSVTTNPSSKTGDSQ